MPINHTHQIDVLKDILSNHQVDCCGSVSECEQLERIVKSLIVNTNINENVKSILTDIYSYSQTGQYTQHLDEHITTHQDQLSQWVSDINEYS